MSLLRFLGLILLLIGILLLFGPLTLPFIFPEYVAGAVVGSIVLESITWLPGIIFIIVGAWLYRKK